MQKKKKELICSVLNVDLIWLSGLSSFKTKALFWFQLSITKLNLFSYILHLVLLP